MLSADDMDISESARFMPGVRSAVLRDFSLWTGLAKATSVGNEEVSREDIQSLSVGVQSALPLATLGVQGEGEGLGVKDGLDVVARHFGGMGCIFVVLRKVVGC